MNLLTPLALKKVETESVNCVPTKEFFKAVLVLIAPLDRENAKLLGCDYLFDANGVPHHFEGTHRPEGEVSGAYIRFGSELEMKTEKVGRFGVFKVADELHLRLRAHLPDTDEAGMMSLFSFLKRFNKDSYDLTITDQQGALELKPSSGAPRPSVEHSWPEPGEGGVYAVDKATRRPFSARKLKASVYILQVQDDQYLFGWEIDCKFADAFTAGRIPNVADAVSATSEAALTRAAYDLHDVIRMKMSTTTPGEAAAHKELVSFLVDLDPTLFGDGKASA